MTTQETQPNSSSEDLEKVLSQLTPDQIRFVVARQECTTDKKAAEETEIKPNTVSYWKAHGVPLDEAVRLMALDGLATALYVRKRSLAKAMMVKVAGLDSDNEAVRQRSSTEIIEWEMGKATQYTKLGGEGEDGSFIVRVVGGINVEDV